MEPVYMTAEELGSIFRSKRDLHKILTIDSKLKIVDYKLENYLLPSYKRCPLEFIRQIIADEKKVSISLKITCRH